MKRAVAILILFSMGLHCASRLGFISYLHSQRHSIAFSVGLIAEIPIEVCGSDYGEKNAPLVILEHNESEKQVPSTFTHAKPIELFSQESLSYEGWQTGLDVSHQTREDLSHYPSPDLAVFHPPCEA